MLQHNIFFTAPTKAELRQQMKSYSILDSNQQAADIHLLLTAFLETQSGTWAAYHHMKEEPDISQILSDNLHIRWVYPKVGPETLEFYTVDQQKVLIEDLEGLLIPALAYDGSGVRLGRGKGHYDRTLKSFKKLKIGICFNHQFFTQLPQEDFDVKVDKVITAAGIIHCRG